MPPESTEFPRLFEPLQVGGARLRNRIVFPAVVSVYGARHGVTDRMVAFYEERARGGAGMIVTEGLLVHASSLAQPALVTVYDPDKADGLARLAAAVEGHDCRLVGQLWHVGRQQLWSPVEAPQGVSSLPDALSWSVPHVMSAGDIREIVAAYVACAEVLKAAGFSGVELHGAHGYLITQFLSPWSNRRDDEYGGDLEGRTRFVREVAAGIRDRCGAAFVVGLKMPGDEGVAGGIDAAEAARIARRLHADAGLDYIGFAQGNFTLSLEDHVPDMQYPPGPFMALQKGLRAAVPGLPVIAFGRVTGAAHAETLLAEGVGDLVGMARALVSDPALPAKARRGRPDTVRPCVFCNQCWGEIHAGKPIACVHNPLLGIPGEAEWRPPAAARRRRVVVVGAGVAGLEAACVAAERGHDVVLLGNRQPGGKLRVEAALPGRADMAQVYEHQIRRLRAAGGRVEFAGFVDVGKVVEQGPDSVILATGSRLRRLALDDQRAVDARTLLERGLDTWADMAGTAVLFDQDQTLAVYALADLLATRFERVVLLTPRTQLGRPVPYVAMIGAFRRLYRAGVEIVHAALPKAFDGDRLSIDNVFGAPASAIENVTLLTYVTPREADDALAAPLRALGIDTRLAGDCYAPRGLMAAVHEGHRVGLSV